MSIISSHLQQAETIQISRPKLLLSRLSLCPPKKYLRNLDMSPCDYLYTGPKHAHAL